MKNLLVVAVLLCSLAVFGQSSTSDNGPNCGGPDNWAANMTFAHLKNAGLLDNRTVEMSKTTAVRVASQRIARDLWKQVYDVRFTKKSGDIVEAIAVHEASKEECSMTGVEVFVVSKRLGDTETSAAH